MTPFDIRSPLDAPIVPGCRQSRFSIKGPRSRSSTDRLPWLDEPCRLRHRRALTGQTRVDLLHLLEDLRDAFRADPESTALTVIDDGTGMSRAQLRRPAFDEILAPTYPHGVRVSVNGRLIPRAAAAPVRLLVNTTIQDRAALEVRLPRKRKPSAVGWIARSDEPVPDAERGVAVSTLGKVIRRGWDWLGITPAAGDRLTGLIEAPGLAEALQLNKADFIRTGPRGATYLAYRKAVQEAVRQRLDEWGEGAPPREKTRPRTARSRGIWRTCWSTWRLTFPSWARSSSAGPADSDASRSGAPKRAGPTASGRATRARRLPTSRGPGPDPRRSSRPLGGASKGPLRSGDSLRVPAGGRGARATRRVHRLGQRRPPRMAARRGLTGRRLPHRALRRNGARPARRRAGWRPRVHQHVSRPLG